MCGAQDWLVYLIEDIHGQQLWLFWSEPLADWVSDHERATRYAGVYQAGNVAESLSDEQGVEASVIRADQVV